MSCAVLALPFPAIYGSTEKDTEKGYNHNRKYGMAYVQETIEQTGTTEDKRNIITCEITSGTPCCCTGASWVTASLEQTEGGGTSVFH